jgi:ABC-type polysaccharide/polyol phosphate export permease
MEYLVEIIEVLTGVVYWIGVIGFPIVGTIIGLAMCAMISPNFSDRALVLFGISGFACGIIFAILNFYNPDYGKAGFTNTGLVLITIGIFAVGIKIASSNPATEREWE